MGGIVYYFIREQKELYTLVFSSKPSGVYHTSDRKSKLFFRAYIRAPFQSLCTRDFEKWCGLDFDIFTSFPAVTMPFFYASPPTRLHNLVVQLRIFSPPSSRESFLQNQLKRKRKKVRGAYHTLNQKASFLFGQITALSGVIISFFLLPLDPNLPRTQKPCFRSFHGPD